MSREQNISAILEGLYQDRIVESSDLPKEYINSIPSSVKRELSDTEHFLDFNTSKFTRVKSSNKFPWEFEGVVFLFNKEKKLTNVIKSFKGHDRFTLYDGDKVYKGSERKPCKNLIDLVQDCIENGGKVYKASFSLRGSGKNLLRRTSRDDSDVARQEFATKELARKKKK